MLIVDWMLYPSHINTATAFPAVSMLLPGCNQHTGGQKAQQESFPHYCLNAGATQGSLLGNFLPLVVKRGGGSASGIAHPYEMSDGDCVFKHFS